LAADRAGRARPSLQARFVASLAALDPGWERSRYVLGFSGGRDSTALAALLAGTLPPGRALAATLDHGIREGSADEAARAAEAARSLGLEALTGRAGVPAEARARGKGLEEAGRAARYRFLAEAKASFGADFILTAHHAGDSAETVLLKIARGAGPGALVGIPARSGDVLRPLLPFRREELEGYLASRGLAWIEDPSNADARFLRNRVRERALPLFLDLNPRFLEALARGALISRDEEDFWLARLALLEGRLVRPAGGIPEAPGPGAAPPGDPSPAAAARREAAGGPGASPGPPPPGAPAPDPDALAGGPFLVGREGFLSLHPAERRRLMGRLIRRVRLPGPSGGEPAQLAGTEAALAFALSGKRGGIDLPGGRRIERRGAILYLGLASRYDAARRG
jgi:tRNA(Ile)-lysidine synthase